MAFFRFSRDKRGYEHFYLVEPVTNRKGKSRSRVLYWYRTPPNVKVGRAPFDDEVRRALEAQYPGVEFDWNKITDAPIPSAETEKWRERRRVERVERATRSVEPVGTRDEESAASSPDADLQEPDAGEPDAEIERAITAGAIDQSVDSVETSEEADSRVGEPSATGQAAPRDVRARRRRRRRRGRGDHAHGDPSVAPPADSVVIQTVEPDPQTVTPPDDPIERFGE